MKIKELWIEKYKILEKFKITFDSQLTVMIGENGAGKSTIIEIIAKIFYDLYLHFVLGKGSKPEDDFKLRYDIEYEKVVYEVYITANKKTKEYYEVNIAGDGKASKKFSKAEINNHFINGYKNILPQNVVMYYAGISEILLNRFKEFQKEFILDSLDGEIKIEQPFFYFQPQNLSTILIGLLSYQYGGIPGTLKKQFGISEFKEITITIKKPNWAKSPSSDNFWGSLGDLKVFLGKLREACNKEIVVENGASFIFTTKEELEEVWSFYGEEKHIFKYLNILQANDLIENIEIILLHKKKEISFERLSEGEKQFLILYGLKELLITDNSIFLLDEPDTYLHPAWQRDFVKSLIDMEDTKTNYLITSHSPNIISGLKREQLRILENIENKTNIRDFSFNPYGQPVDRILIDYFDLKGLRYIDVEKEITELQEMLTLDKFNLEEFTSLYTKLEKLIGKDDIDLLSIKLEKLRRANLNEKN
ncbi:AAA family ATPase [bacterium]|nr:AAA family ATPase [bacterium]PIQ07626.1 MAG: hypothetical protein COW71_15880 [Ignavibacteriales bacterium CG18_big_fil_WC_8_21_14_2_50_31_20]